MKYCTHCGRRLYDNATYCPRCGQAADGANQASVECQDECATQMKRTLYGEASDKSALVALLLCVFAGNLGVHRFYVGKTGTGLLWLFTCGLFGIGGIVDLILIAIGSFTDCNGRPLTRWD